MHAVTFPEFPPGEFGSHFVAIAAATQSISIIIYGASLPQLLIQPPPPIYGAAPSRPKGAFNNTFLSNLCTAPCSRAKIVEDLFKG